MQPHWTLIASHGTVLFYVATHEETTIREIAHTIDLTERRVAQIIHDLTESGALAVERRGRRNAYRINPEARFENPYCDVPLGQVVDLIRDAGEAARTHAVA